MSEVSEVLGNANIAQTNMRYNIDAKRIIEKILEIIEEDKEDIIEANTIDVNNNGFELNYDEIRKIFEEVLSINDEYGKLKSMNRAENSNHVNGIQTDKVGNVGLIYDGNTYVMIEMILKCILTHNSLIIISESDYMKASNELVIILVHRVLQYYNVDSNLIQSLYISQMETILYSNARINKVFVIGDNDLQQRVKRLSKIETVYIGSGEYDIYTEDSGMVEQLNQLLEKNIKTNLYVKKGIEIPFEECFYVEDISEAIGQINFNSSGFSSCIFTDNGDSAIRFLREVKTKNVYVNSVPDNGYTMYIDLALLCKNKRMNFPNAHAEKIEVYATLDENENVQYEIDNLKQENSVLKINNQEIQEESEKKIEEKNQEINELKRQLRESQTLVNKYIKLFQKSIFSRIFAKLSKEDLEKDIKMLSE